MKKKQQRVNGALGSSALTPCIIILIIFAFFFYFPSEPRVSRLKKCLNVDCCLLALTKKEFTCL